MPDQHSVMQEFPSTDHQQVTLANWRTPPYCHWAFHHVREIIPSANIRHQPENVWALESAPVNLGGLSIDSDNMGVMSLAGYISQANIDAMIVLHRDKIVFEQYHRGMNHDDPHILMSVSKSLLGILCGVLIHHGKLDPNQPAAVYVPELKSTGYKNTTVRQLLDMRAGVDFTEDYEATSGLIINYRKATGWNPLAKDEAASDLRSFYQQMTATKGKDGGPFSYVSPNTDLLAWVIERACNAPYAKLLGEYLWQPMGAEADAYITVDKFGAPRAAGGVCTTLRDLARVARLIACGGKREGQQILAPGWIEDLIENGDQDSWNNGDFSGYFPDLPYSYRSKWYICHPNPTDEARWFMALGIHGQNIYIDPQNEFVMVKFSSDPVPSCSTNRTQGFSAAKAIRDYLVNHF